mgnify:CR=1 FL=1
MYCFPKSEKLCGKKNISKLYNTGNHFTCYPFRITWIKNTTHFNNPQVLIWAPKSIFKRANKRNNIRRIIRETYRLNSLPLKNKCKEKNLNLDIAFNYIAKEPLPFIHIEKTMKRVIEKLILLCEQ